MNRTKIDWADYSWNPVTGCLGPDGRGPCTYCYAKRIAGRFGADTYYFDTAYPDRSHLHYIRLNVEEEFIDLNFKDQKSLPMMLGNREYRSLYPFNFEPTFHEYRLGEPQWIKKPSCIFVGSMGDTFGSWVPDDWITRVLAACLAAPQHQYLFLTKNPARYLAAFGHQGLIAHWWLGATRTTRADTLTVTQELAQISAMGWHTWVSAEPLLEDIAPYIEWNYINWLVIGAMTGPGAKNHQPQREWVRKLYVEADNHGIPVFMKRSLQTVIGNDPEDSLIQQYPKAMTKES